MLRTTLTVLLALACLATVTGAAAAAPVTGTVTVDNGTAEGDRVTVTPLDANFQRAGQPVTATVRDGTYRATDVADAPTYVVRLEHAGASHYRLVREGRADFTLSAGLSARLVRPDGTPVRDARLAVASPVGPPVTRLRTGADGRVALGSLQPNRTYRLRAQLDGAPYRYLLRTGTNASDRRLTVRPPTADGGTLTATGGDPASHVVQPVRNGSTTRVVETVRLRNAGDRPFVGPLRVGVPANATVQSVSIQGQRLRHRRTDGGVAVNASLAAGSSIRVSATYDLAGGTLTKRVAHRTDTLAVVVEGYDLSQVEHSDRLRAVNDSRMPVPMLTSRGSLSAGDRISVTLPGAGGETGSGSSGGSMPRFPAGEFAAALLAVVGVGIAVYRTV